MKNIVASVCLLLFLGCGGNSTSNVCSNSLVKGSWSGTILGNADTTTFNEDCTGGSTYCAMVFTYPDATSSSGNVQFNVTATNGNAGCLAVGTHVCSYVVNGNTFQFNCGNGTATYTR
jgi:hypothetical protein